MKKRIKSLIEVSLITFLIFFIPLYTSLVINLYVGYEIYKKFGWQKAGFICGISIVLIVLDNFAHGRQDYFRAVMWAFQALWTHQYYLHNKTSFKVFEEK